VRLDTVKQDDVLNLLRVAYYALRAEARKYAHAIVPHAIVSVNLPGVTVSYTDGVFVEKKTKAPISLNGSTSPLLELSFQGNRGIV